jgi:hypothetical protein
MRKVFRMIDEVLSIRYAMYEMIETGKGEEGHETNDGPLFGSCIPTRRSLLVTSVQIS